MYLQCKLSIGRVDQKHRVYFLDNYRTSKMFAASASARHTETSPAIYITEMSLRRIGKRKPLFVITHSSLSIIVDPLEVQGSFFFIITQHMVVKRKESL